MSRESPSAEPSPLPDAQAAHRTYWRPELRDLGPLTELTQTLGGPPGSSDALADPAYSNS